MSDHQITRRDFMRDGAVVTAGAAAAMTAADGLGGAARAATDAKPWRKTRSFNADMAYRRLGKTDLWISAICLGGHWKRINKAMGASKGLNPYRLPGKGERDAFDKNRLEVVSRCLEVGINCVDACTGGEVMAYAKALRGRRDRMYISYSWYEKEVRSANWRTTAKLLQSIDEGLKASGLEYVDVWRIVCHERGSRHTQGEIEQMVAALDKARKQGKCRYTGVSSHDRPWLKMLIEKYPDVMQVVLFPYTASSMELPKDSLFDAVRKHDVGVLGIKPFGSNSLFKGDSSAGSPHAAEDDKRARLAIRHILANPAITAPIPGLISSHQVDNMAAAAKERRTLDAAEKAELDRAVEEMWANLPEGYEWLKDWQYV